MTQPSIFDAPPPLRLPTLPHRGLTPEAAAASLSGAEQARVRRDQLRARYLELLLRRGICGVTDHEAAAALNVGVSSLCSTRAALRTHLAPHGHRPGPTGAANTVWVLRILVHQSLTEGTCASHED